VAKRAEVLVARRRIGFGQDGRPEHFVVLQADLLAGIDTVVVAPLDEVAAMYEEDPLVVRVTAKEAGTRSAHVVLAHLLAAVSVDRFEPAPAGRLSARSMDRIAEKLRVILEL
jgi:hypothetical protein